MKKFSIKAISFLILILCVSFILTGCNKQPTKTQEADMLKTDGIYIKNTNGDIINLRGVNIGGWLIQESWMCPTECKDQTSLNATLVERFGKHKADELINIYLDNWFTEQDLINIKNLGLNTVRLPFAYFNIEDNESNYTQFERLDYIVDLCDKHDMYVILDLHGAKGSQNGRDHSGKVGAAELFDSEENMADTVKLWEAVATRYKTRDCVAGYDLLNEPEGTIGKTTKLQWDFFDRCIKAIRQIDSEHIIFLNAVWDTYNMPRPEQYGWTNVVYQYHNYCWEDTADYTVQTSFIDKKISMYNLANYNVPIYVGEFTCFENKEVWDYVLTKLNENHINWTIWTYKVIGKGSSWGIMTSNIEKVNPEIDSYETIKSKWEKSKSTNFTENPLVKNALVEHAKD